MTPATSRYSTRFRWRRAGGAAAITLALALTALAVAAQPRTATPSATSAPDAGRGGTTGKRAARMSDAGAPLPGDRDAAPARASNLLGGPVPTFRPRPPPLPPPTPEQVSAYQAMRQEADAYERGAGDYKDAITSIITLHYEEKKKAILGSLEHEIGIEKGELKKARENAIRRLEDFVAKYSGPSAQPEATPDAMYRLAALYEERARTEDDPNADLAVTLKPAIALYKRTVREFPGYTELAGIYYFLGHALNDARRTNEAEQVWRSLVCHNHYSYPSATDPKDPDIDVVAALPQDHDEGYWRMWRNKYPTPESLKKGPPEDTTFSDPYPQDCAIVAQPHVLPGQEPKYVSEIWWRMGDWEFDQLDVAGGVVEYEPFAVWDYNRAASAYMHAMQYNKPPLYGVALYKYAWTLFKQQRYEAAVHEFIHLLNYTDEQQRLTGDPGADFRQEAFTYIAGSLDNYDFAGPGPEEPFVARPDILDTARSPTEAETKLRIALDRVQDPRIVPQDQPWTLEIYKALAMEFRAINQYRNALAVYQLMLDRWPMDPSAPDAQNAIAEVYDLLARQTKVGDDRREYEQKVLEARTGLAKYIGDTSWVDANKDNPVALQRAEQLVRTGLKGAAITHTRNGQAAIEQGDQTGDPKEKLRLTNFALQEYKLAAIGWLGYLKQDENAPDAYKSRYFYADALHNEVRLQVALHQFDPRQYAEPTSSEIGAAEQAAVDVRDSDEDDQFIDNAGLFVVDLADVDRDLAFQRFAESGGTQGIETRKDPKLEGQVVGEQQVVIDAMPEVLLKSMQARDDYIQRVPPERDRQNHATDYAFYSAREFYAYGHFKEAQERAQPIYDQHCGKDPIGYEAWKLLITMSNLSNDSERSAKLAEAEQKHSCAVSAADIEEEKKGTLIVPVLQNAKYRDANKVFEQAKAASPGPAQDALWRKAGELYEAALRAAPGHKDAPAAAIDSAYCYKQLGEFNKAIELYQLFINSYGSEDNLNRLEHGGIDPATKAKVAADAAEYKERINYLGMAYDALSTTYYGFFAYQRAAESFAKIATTPRFDDQRRSNAARIAMVLYSNLGDRNNMSRMYDVFVDPKMHLTADKRAEADYLKASFDYGLYNPSGGESSGNAAARRQAIGTLTQFHSASRNRPESARYALESAYRVAKMMQSANDPGFRTWFKTAIADWEYFKGHAASGASGGKPSQISATDAPYSDYGAEAEFTLLDEEVKSEFDYATGHHRYAGNAPDILKQLDKDLGEADKVWRPKLEHVAVEYGSFEWAAAASARIGSLYDSIRTGLDLVVPNYFTAQQEGLLKKLQKVADQLRSAGQDAKADEIEEQINNTKDAVRAKWRSTKDQYMEVSTKQAIGRYATAALTARKYNVKTPAVTNAIARLAYFTDYLGDDKMKSYVETTADPLNAGSRLVYTNGEFLQWRSGVVSTPPPNGEPPPLPVAP